MKVKHDINNTKTMETKYFAHKISILLTNIGQNKLYPLTNNVSWIASFIEK